MAQDTATKGKAEPRQTSAAAVDKGVADFERLKLEAAKKAAANDGESKADRFRRLANKRVPKAVKALQNICNLGNARQYEYTPAQVSKIIDTIRAAADDVERAFKGGAADEKSWSL